MLKPILLVEDNPHDLELVAAISDLGIFWAVLNEPPPGSLRYKRANQNPR